MDRSRRQLLVTASASALVGVLPQAAVASCEAPVWRQFKGDARRTGRSALHGPRRRHVVWKSIQPMQSPMSVAADGTVYFGGDQGIVYAHSAAGDLLWGHPLGGGYITAGTAILDDGSILVVPEQARARCFAPNGDMRWTFDLQGFNGVYSAPLLTSDGTVYIGNDQRLVALRQDGSLKWSFPVRVSGPPAEALDGSIVLPSSLKLVALSPQGRLRWIADSGLSTYGLSSAPAVGDDGTIYVNSLRGQLVAFSPQGARLWTTDTQGLVCDVAPSPAIGRDGTVYFAASYRDIHAANPDGTLRWTTPTVESDSFSALTLGSDDTIYFGAATGRVHAMSPQGVPLWDRFVGNGDENYYVRSAPVPLPHHQLLVGAYDGVFVLGN